jgi:hypothetical protein
MPDSDGNPLQSLIPQGWRIDYERRGLSCLPVFLPLVELKFAVA